MSVSTSETACFAKIYMAAKKTIITLTTDFGLKDHFVGVMKGVILSINPEAELVDITHDIPPQDVLQAAFTLKHAYSYFPAGTIHVVVVDPGVGTSRKALVASSEKGFFLAPDNGVLSHLYADNVINDVREITADHYWLKPRTGTFDGRDIFAPVAAWMSKGVSISSLGESITGYTTIDIPQPALVQPGIWKCKILSVDRFGNLISNLTREQFAALIENGGQKRFAFRVGEQTISKISKAYAEGQPNEVLAVFGSCGFVEFCVNQGSAAAITTLQAGKDVLLKVV